MKKIHDRLSRKYSWYAVWHSHPRHSLAHWALLALFVVLVVSNIFYTTAKSTYGTIASPEALAEVNNLHILKEGEYAILTNFQGAAAGKKMVKQSMVVNGETQTFDVPEGSTLSMIVYDPLVTTTISMDTPGLTLYRMADFTGFDSSGIVDTAISRMLKKQDKVSVIVRLKTASRFYNASDTQSVRASKSQAFATAKSSIAGSIKGNGNITHELKIINGFSIEVNEKALEGLKKNPNVAQVTLDREVAASLDTSVDQIDAPSVWPMVDAGGNTLTGVGVRIAIIDTGVDYTHPDLGGCLGATCKVIGGYDFVNNDTNPMDDQGHGTHVAATAAGNGLLKGVAPDAQIVAYKVLNSGGSGSFSAIIAAVDRATDPNQDGNPSDHVDVANMSLGASCGTYSSGCGPDDSVALAVDNSSAAGVVHVIAAGNSGPGASTVGTPGVARSAITVAAGCKTSQIGTISQCATPIASFSSRGPVVWNGTDIQKPDITAPGVLICAARWATAFASGTPCFDTAHIRISGTSMATPHMAGVAALIKQANPSYTPALVKQRIKDTAQTLSGVAYSDQGAGEVDVKSAIPLVSKIKTTPAIWNAATTATQKVSSSSQSFSVTSGDASVAALSLDFSTPVAGITFSSSKTALNVANLGTDSFTGTVHVDNDVTPAGKYTTIIYLVENGERKGAIIVPVIVTPTVTASVVSIDYGIDSPSLSSWTSPTKQITFTNARTDSAQVVTISSSVFPTGITYEKSPTTLTIPANGSASVDTSFLVNNTNLANKVYTGTLTASYAASSVDIAIKFAKFYSVTLQDANSGDHPNIVSFAKVGGSERVTITPTSYPHTLYFNAPGIYVVSSFYSPQGTGPSQFVIRENVTVDGNSILTTSRTEAKNKIALSGTKATGITTQYTSSNIVITKSDYIDAFGVKYGANGGVYMSDMSTNYGIIAQINATSGNASEVYLFGGRRLGLTSQWDITNTVADLKKVAVQHDVNKPAGSKFMPLIYGCIYRGLLCESYFSSNDLKTVPYTQDVYTSVSYEGTPFLARADWFDNTPNKYFSTQQFDAVSGARKLWGGTNLRVADIYQNKVYSGLGPTIWFSKFNNTASKIEMVSSVGDANQPLTPIVRQDFALSTHSAIPYTINKDAVSVITGSFKSFSADVFGIGALATHSAVAGVYDFHTAFPYQNQGKDMLGTVDAVFDTTRTDPNPPYISRLYYFGNGTRIDVYDPTATNRLDVDIDPNGGAMATVSLEMSADGGAFTPVAISGVGTYSATLPSVTATTKVALRLTAVDAANNSFAYTFELPIGTVQTPNQDTVPPTATLTSPTNGATLASTVTVAATAADNIGVDHVDFYRGTTLIGADATAPYTMSWDTTMSTNGQYTLTAKAYDANGNSASSSGVSVTVSNTVTPPADTIAPTTAITIPVNGATIGGVVGITAIAADAVGVTKVEFYRGSTLINTDTTGSPEYVVAWYTTSEPDGSYTLTSKAYDAAGNTTVSTPITVTVDNVDTTAPTVSITSPLTNSTHKANTALTIAVTAADAIGVAKVDVFNGTSKICTDTIAPYTCTWTIPKAPNKKYSLTSKAYDAAGNIGTSAVVQVTSTK